MTKLQRLKTIPAPGRAPAGLAWDGQSVWINDYQTGVLDQLDPTSGEKRASLLCPGVISGLAWDGDSLWQSRMDEDWLQQINPISLDFDVTVPVEGYGRLVDLAWDGQQLWVASQRASKLLAVNTETGEVKRSLPMVTASAGLTFGNGALWLGHAYQMQFDSQSSSFEWIGDERHYYLLQLNPNDGQEIARFELDFLPMGLDWVGEYLWLTHAGTGEIRIYHLT